MDVRIRGDRDAGVITSSVEFSTFTSCQFLAGSETDPAEIARQYAQIVGTSAGVILVFWSASMQVLV